MEDKGSTPANPDENDSKAGPILLSSIFLVTAAVLAFIGYALDQEDAANMEGLQRILFTVVSIRWFAWIFAVVFASLGILVLKKGREEGSSAD